MRPSRSKSPGLKRAALIMFWPAATVAAFGILYYLAVGTPVAIIRLLPFLVAAFFWMRGLWRAKMGDCAAALAVASIWSVLLLSAATGVTAIHTLGLWAIGLAIVTFGCSVLLPNRPMMTKRDLMSASAFMMVLGLFLLILL